MLELEMLKKIIFFVIYVCLTTFLNAREPFVAVLFNVVSNETQLFNSGGYDFCCKPYGILTLETLHSNSKSGSLCQKKIEIFYKKNPDLKYFTYKILNYKQRYHIEFKDKKCVLYAKGEVSLSELLLKEGLAVQKPLFKDEEFGYIFFQAQQKAKFEKKGLWNDKILESCMKELYRNQ